MDFTALMHCVCVSICVAEQWMPLTTTPPPTLTENGVTYYSWPLLATPPCATTRFPYILIWHTSIALYVFVVTMSPLIEMPMAFQCLRGDSVLCRLYTNTREHNAQSAYLNSKTLNAVAACTMYMPWSEHCWVCEWCAVFMPQCAQFGRALFISVICI